jgi:hypothetical protein
MEGGSDGKDTLVSGIQELFVDICNEIVLQGDIRRVARECRRLTHLCKAKELIVDRTDCFLNCLFEIPSNTHDLSHTLHATA